MRTLTFLCVLTAFFCLSLPQDAWAQKKKKKDKPGKEEKAEAKKWKNKLKQTDPLEFKQMSEDYSQLKAESGAARSKVTKVQNEMEQAKAQLSSKDQQIADLQTQIAQAEQDLKGEAVNASPQQGDMSKGLVFKVQVGAFSQKDFTQFQGQTFVVEQVDGVRKYTVGFFREYCEADAFKKYLIAMGLRDAWIVVYKDNQRRNVKEVLPNAEEIEKNGCK